jgi:hypothetical protein
MTDRLEPAAARPAPWHAAQSHAAPEPRTAEAPPTNGFFATRRRNLAPVPLAPSNVKAQTTGPIKSLSERDVEAKISAFEKEHGSLLSKPKGRDPEGFAAIDKLLKTTAKNAAAEYLKGQEDELAALVKDRAAAKIELDLDATNEHRMKFEIATKAVLECEAKVDRAKALVQRTTDIGIADSLQKAATNAINSSNEAIAVWTSALAEYRPGEKNQRPHQIKVIRAARDAENSVRTALRYANASLAAWQAVGSTRSDAEKSRCSANIIEASNTIKLLTRTLEGL